MGCVALTSSGRRARVLGHARRHSSKRPYLDGAVRGDRVLGRHLDRLVQVAGLDDVEAGDLLLGLGERAVGDQHLAVADAGGAYARDGYALLEAVYDSASARRYRCVPKTPCRTW